jgi:hypothetical protein
MTLEPSTSPFVEQLIAQKDYYQAQIDQYERQASFARQQLTHINALLLDQFLPASDSSPIAIAATRQETYPPALMGATAAISPELAELATNVDQILTSPTVAEPQTEPSKPKRTAPKRTVKATAKPSAKRKQPRPQTKLPLLAPYAHLSKIDAVGQVLQEHRGSDLNTETIIQTLYGDLSAADLKAERTRMRATLNHGTRKKLWNRLEKRGGRYSLEKLAGKKEQTKAKSSRSALPSRRESQKTVQPKSKPTSKQTVKKSAPGKAKAAGQSLMEKVISAMQAHPGEVMTSETVARIIFGSLPSRDWAAARKRISGIFSQGVRQKKWQRLPNEKGAYVL